MAADGISGTKNQPQFLDGGAPDLANDSNIIANYAAKVGNRRVGTTAERNAATGKDVWEGLEWEDTTLGMTLVRRGGAWGQASPVREWVFLRNSQNQSDTFNQGTFTGIVSGTIPDAPAGYYRYETQAVLSAAQAATGFLRILASPGQSNTSGNVRADFNPGVTPVRLRGFSSSFGGGTLTVEVQTQISSGVGTVQTAGTNLTITYLGKFQ